MLYGYGLRVGIRAVLHGRIDKPVLKRLVLPVNYWRNCSYRFTFEELHAGPGDRVLDIGSPKLLSLFLAERTGAGVFSTDLSPYFVSDYRVNRDLAHLPPGQFFILQQDGRHLSFPDSFFSRAYSISVIEHIPGAGDTECMREVRRVLRPGGRFIVTVPFHPRGRIDYRRPDFYWSNPHDRTKTAGRVFYQRRYSETELRKRLIEPSGLNPVKLVYIGNALPEGGFPPWPEYLASLPGPIQLALTRWLIKGPVEDWHTLRHPSAVYLVLEKTRG